MVRNFHNMLGGAVDRANRVCGNLPVEIVEIDKSKPQVDLRST